MAITEAKGLQKRAPRHPVRRTKRELREFNPTHHIRGDWDDRHLSDELERRARGYGDPFRKVLCSAAAMIRRQRQEMDSMVAERYEAADEARVQAELVEEDQPGG